MTRHGWTVSHTQYDIWWHKITNLLHSLSHPCLFLLILISCSDPPPHFPLFLFFFSLYAPSPSPRSTSSSLSAAVVYCAYRSEPRLVCGRGQYWPVWRRPMERERVAGAFPVRCGNRQRVHFLVSQLRDHPAGQNHTGRLGSRRSKTKDRISCERGCELNVIQ